MEQPAQPDKNEEKISEAEKRRLDALARYENPVSEPGQDEAFDRLARLAAQLCDAPIAFINLIGAENEFKKACYGFEGKTTSRSVSFCNHTILQNDVFEVPDATKDSRFKTNPNVSGELNLRFYAGVPLQTQDGHNIGSLCIVDHEPRTLEDSQKDGLRILADEIVSRYELKHLKERTEKRNAEKDELIRIVSHDMRNPLTGIIGFSELLKQETENSEHREMLEYIESAGESMLNIVNVLLNSEYIRNEAFIINRRKVDATALTRTVIDLHQPLVQLKNLDLRLDIEPELVCSLDGEKWKQIVGNLLNNAVKFTPQDGKISLRLSSFTTRRTFLKLEITDNGIGMSDDMVDNLFSGKDSIRREGTKGEESTGLGMYIVHKYVRLMRGTIDIHSKQGQGTKVDVQIPA